MKPLSTLLATLVATTLASGAAAQTLHLVTENAFPFQYVDDNRIKGMAVDVVSEMAKRAGVPISLEMAPWKDAYDRAQRDRQTCIFSTARLENREKLFKWVGPIVENRWSAFGRKGISPKPANLRDLRYLRVGVLDGDAKATFLMDNGVASALNRLPDDAQIPPLLTVDRKEPGKIDVWVTGHFSARHIAAKSGVQDIEYLLSVHASPNYLACNYGVKADTLKKLSASLSAMKQDGSYQKIIDSYDPLSLNR